MVRRFLNLEMPACPPLNLACVDVRDVARAHIEAMRRPESDGQRFLVILSDSLKYHILVYKPAVLLVPGPRPHPPSRVLLPGLLDPPLPGPLLGALALLLL